jgi:hypothetical protein
VQLNVSLLPMYLQELFTTRIHVSADMLLHPEQVQDIGYIIRDIILHRQRHDVLFKLYQYTMPFIKHNRLNFPPMQCTSRVVLRHMMQVIALTCLGLYSPQNKKPTWNIRRQLFRFFTTLMTRGSLRDVYVFCLHNTYLLRLALMEYFIFFSSKYMMTEMQLLLECSGLTYNPIRTKTLIEYISDHFRTAALQNELLDWSLIESKAQLAVERCNRTCKAQQHHACEPQQSLGEILDSVHMRHILASPRVDASNCGESLQRTCMLHSAASWALISKLRKFALQRNNRTIVARTMLYVCLRCNTKHVQAKGDMRMQYPGPPVCRHCNSSSMVCEADTLGHLVKVYSNYYYFCVDCSRVHCWCGTGRELSSCPWQDQKSYLRRNCAVCSRTQMLSRVSVFDKTLGIMQSLFLCSKHCPPQVHMQCVYDLCSLRRLIQHHN